MTTLREHWNKIYANNPVNQLGWYEANPAPSIELINHCAVAKNAPILDIGSGVSTLIPQLLELGYQNLNAVDISETALEKAKASLGEGQTGKVTWIVDDITKPAAILQLRNMAVWHDRAVFHFLTEEHDRQVYHSVLDKTIMPGGFIIMAAFALNGAEKCSGLPVQRYSVGRMSDFLGDAYQLVEGMEYTFRMPSGDLRPYVYARFQKVLAP